MCFNEYRENIIPQTKAPIIPDLIEYSISREHRECHHAECVAVFHCTVTRAVVDEESAITAIEHAFRSEIDRIVQVYRTLNAIGPFNLSVAVSSKGSLIHNFFDYNYGPALLYEDFVIKYDREIAPEFCVNVLSKLPKQLKIGFKNNPKIECPMCQKLF